MAGKNEKELLEEISTKLGALIALSLNDKKPDTTKEKIKLLNSFKLDYKMIASIIGSSESNVAKEISLIKKGKKK